LLLVLCGFNLGFLAAQLGIIVFGRITIALLGHIQDFAYLAGQAV
jgi:hypothetical protein